MNPGELVALVQQAVVMAMYLAVPPLLAAAAAGWAIGWLQGSIGSADAAVGTAPRLLAAGLAALVFGAWMLSLIGGYWFELWRSIPELVG
jgi:flagellar biosynthetic protein FliQ